MKCLRLPLGFRAEARIDRYEGMQKLLGVGGVYRLVIRRRGWGILFDYDTKHPRGYPQIGKAEDLPWYWVSAGRLFIGIGRAHW